QSVLPLRVVQLAKGAQHSAQLIPAARQLHRRGVGVLIVGQVVVQIDGGPVSGDGLFVPAQALVDFADAVVRLGGLGLQAPVLAAGAGDLFVGAQQILQQPDRLGRQRRRRYLDSVGAGGRRGDEARRGELVERPVQRRQSQRGCLLGLFSLRLFGGERLL